MDKLDEMVEVIEEHGTQVERELLRIYARNGFDQKMERTRVIYEDCLRRVEQKRRQRLLAAQKVLVREVAYEFKEYIIQHEGKLQLIHVDNTETGAIGMVVVMPGRDDYIRETLRRLREERKEDLKNLNAFLKQAESKKGTT